MASDSSLYCLRWGNYLRNMTAVFKHLFETEEFSDVTLWLDGGNVTVKCHKIVLAACSLFFEDIFSNMPSKSHTNIVLTEVKYTEIIPIIEYIYRGEIHIPQGKLKGLLKLANSLKIKGLMYNESIAEKYEEKVEAVLSPPPAVSTTMSNAVHSGEQIAVPQSTDGSYNSYEQSQVDYSQEPFPQSLWSYSGHLLCQEQAQSDIAQPDVVTFEGTTKKIKEEPPVEESPIIRNILDQNRSDYSDEFQVRRPDSCAQSHRSQSNESANEHQRHNADILKMGHSLYGNYSKDEDESSSRGQHRNERQDSVRNFPITKPMWKKYKKYSNEELASALEAMRTGLSPIQASKQFKIPSRTLYDKAKKLGIHTKIIRRSSSSSSAAFPTGIGQNINGRIYRGISESEYESTSAVSTENPSTSETSQRDQPHLEDTAMEVSLLNPSSPRPEIRSSTSDANIEDAAEDLSVKDRRDEGVILSTPKR